MPARTNSTKSHCCPEDEVRRDGPARQWTRLARCCCGAIRVVAARHTQVPDTFSMPTFPLHRLYRVCHGRWRCSHHGQPWAGRAGAGPPWLRAPGARSRAAAHWGEHCTGQRSGRSPTGACSIRGWPPCRLPHALTPTPYSIRMQLGPDSWRSRPWRSRQAVVDRSPHWTSSAGCLHPGRRRGSRCTQACPSALPPIGPYASETSVTRADSRTAPMSPALCSPSCCGCIGRLCCGAKSRCRVSLALHVP